MTMDLLKRTLAPILPEAWKVIDDEARRVLTLNLAGRKVVDFKGPFGWSFAAVNTGRLTLLEHGPVADVPSGVRTVQRLVEMRTPFVLDIMELDTVARGADDPDLAPVIAAAERIARAEDTAIFHGYAGGDVTGIIEASPHTAVPVEAVSDWARAVVRAKETLRSAGVGGPYALACGRRAYDELAAESEDGGYPLRKHVEQNIVEGPLVWAPAIADGAVLLSTRGGDFELTVGQDLSIGYAVHDRRTVELYLTESFTFRVLEAAAAVLVKRS